MTVIYVIDTETTGLDGIPFGDSVVEIGIVAVDTETKTVTPVLDEVIKQYIPCGKRDAWIFTSGTMTTRDISTASMKKKHIAKKMRAILTDQYVTSYNKEFDFTRFLNWSPYDIYSYTKSAECIMVAASRIKEIPRSHAGKSRYPKMMYAYEHLCPTDPAHLKGTQDHRACSDALAEGYILLELIDRGVYEV